MGGLLTLCLQLWTAASLLHHQLQANATVVQETERAQDFWGETDLGQGCFLHLRVGSYCFMQQFVFVNSFVNTDAALLHENLHVSKQSCTMTAECAHCKLWGCCTALVFEFQRSVPPTSWYWLTSKKKKFYICELIPNCQQWTFSSPIPTI